MPLINKGIYDLNEIAYLIHATPETVSRWSRSSDGGLPAIVSPSSKNFFTFLDLISLYVTRELRARDVPLGAIRNAIRTLKSELDTESPLAHKKLATVGRSIFADTKNDDNWIDAGLGGQQAFQSLVRPLLRPITYDRDGLAELWRPSAFVVIDPKVQAGAPCLVDTRIPTSLISSMAAAGEELEDLADQFNLRAEQIEAALEFESSLSSAA